MTTEELKTRMEALGLYKDQSDAVLERLAVSVQDHVNDGCPTVSDAIQYAVRESDASGYEADRTHGSGFREV